MTAGTTFLLATFFLLPTISVSSSVPSLQLRRPAARPATELCGNDRLNETVGCGCYKFDHDSNLPNSSWKLCKKTYKIFPPNMQFMCKDSFYIVAKDRVKKKALLKMISDIIHDCPGPKPTDVEPVLPTPGPTFPPRGGFGSTRISLNMPLMVRQDKHLIRDGRRYIRNRMKKKAFLVDDGTLLRSKRRKYALGKQQRELKDVAVRPVGSIYDVIRYHCWLIYRLRRAPLNVAQRRCG